MEIVIKTKNLKLNLALQKYISGKINSLEKFSQIFQDEEEYFFKDRKPKVEAFFEIGKETLHHQKGPYFRAECQMHFPGKSIRAEATSENLEQAIVKVKDKMQKELKQYKEKFISQSKRRSRVSKKELKLSPGARFYRKGRIKEEGI